MFKVIINQLISTCAELENDIRQSNYYSEQLYETITNLSTLSGLEEIIVVIKKDREALEEEILKMKQMLQALSKVVQSYQSCENRIINEYEQTNVLYPKLSIGTVDLGKINTIVNDGGLRWQTKKSQ